MGAETKTERVNGDISDIFFNMDHKPIVDKDSKTVIYQDMHDNAVLLQQCLQRLGVDCPDEEALIADFYKRL
jgi:hypothetical protein